MLQPFWPLAHVCFHLIFHCNGPHSCIRSLVSRSGELVLVFMLFTLKSVMKLPNLIMLNYLFAHES